MLYTCTRCAAAFQANARPADGLCGECRARQGDGRGCDVDWRRPLYERARALDRGNPASLSRVEARYGLLRGYRDADQRLERARAGVRAQFDCAAERIRNSASASELQRALDDLAQMPGFDSDGALRALGERRLGELRAAAAAEEARLEARRRRVLRFRRALALACLGLLAAAFAWHYFKVIPAYNRRGVQAMASGDYDAAVEMFERSGNEERMREAQLAQARQILERGEFESALEMFQSLESEDGESEVYRAWSDALAEQGEIEQAIEKLSLAPSSDARDARLDELRRMRADACADRVLARGAADVEFARAQGESLRELDDQLHYCRRLADAGWDLSEVYPDGVEIEGAPLERYQPDALARGGKAPDADRILLFKRTERDYRETAATRLESMFSHRRDDASSYTFRLLAGPLFALDAERVAQSWEDATCIMLVDDIYLPAGAISVTRDLNQGDPTLGTYRWNYPYFSALSTVAAYDRVDPTSGVVFARALDPPRCADEEWFERNKGSADVVLDIDNRVGDFESEAMMAHLRELLPLYISLTDLAGRLG